LAAASLEALDETRIEGRARDLAMFNLAIGFATVAATRGRND